MRTTVISFFLIALISLPVAVFAGQAFVPQSGQTLCYDAAGVEITCAGTGQDGDQQMGVPWSNPRFTDNGNGTITDNLTGLIWLKNAGCFGYVYNLSAALSAANSLANGACGLTDGSVASDWRLPNRVELKSLINRGQGSPAAWLGTMGFSSIATSNYVGYWSSSTSGGRVWQVSFLNGVDFSYQDNSGYNGYIWPVRGGH